MLKTTSIKAWKPNLIQKILIKLGVIIDPRCKPSKFIADEAYTMQAKYINKNHEK